MAINWTDVLSKVEQAVGGIVGPAWQNASGASTQFAAIIAAGQKIEKMQNMAQAEYDSLKLMQQRALEGVLQTYAGISPDVAQQAAAAAWSAVVAAVKTACPALGLIL
jgi:hypothetical protein